MQELLNFLLHETFSYVTAQEWANIWRARDSLFNEGIWLLGPVTEGGEKVCLWLGATMWTDTSGYLYIQQGLSMSVWESPLSGLCPQLGCKLLTGGARVVHSPMRATFLCTKRYRKCQLGKVCEGNKQADRYECLFWGLRMDSCRPK